MNSVVLWRLLYFFSLGVVGEGRLQEREEDQLVILSFQYISAIILEIEFY